MSSTGKDLLIIAHAFPPSGGASVRRLLKALKYLSLWGWRITVLAPRRGEVFAYPYDPSLLAQIPAGVTVCETFTPETWFAAKHAAPAPAAGSTPRSSLSSLAARARRAIAVPDSAVVWWPFAVRQGLRLVKEHDVDVMLATAPPFSTLLVGAALRRLTGKPLVAEFRDAWTADPGHAQRHGDDWALGLRQAIERRQEAWTVGGADRVVSVTPGVEADFRQRYGGTLGSGKWATIPNGYDRDDAAPPAARAPGAGQQDGTFKIVYTGGMGGVRTPQYFLKAMQSMLLARPELASRLRIIFVGQSSRFADGRVLADYVRDFGLQDVVADVGFVPREESLRYQSEADLLLLLVGVVPASASQYYGLSAKVFDYILSEKPVLALADPGASADFVQAAGVGEVVPHSDETGIVSAVRRAMEGGFHYEPCAAVIDRYDNAVLLRALESLLLDCSAHGRR